MEMSGERRIPAPRGRVWDALNDPEVLRASIPGCESVERVGDDQFQARVGVKIGPMSAKFGGKVRLENLNPPAGYTITGEGSGGAMGFAKGGADVALEEVSAAETLLRYQVKAQVGGKMAQLGARLIDSTAKHMADQFFDRFAANVAAAEAATAPVQPDTGAAVATGMPTILPAPEAEANARADDLSQNPANRAATDARVAMAGAGSAARNTDTEYLRDTTAPGPLTQHGADGPSAGGGKPVYRPNPRPVDPVALKPLRLMLQLEPLGLPIQFWLGSAAMGVILVLMFLW